jgi:hypothetical protein
MSMKIPLAALLAVVALPALAEDSCEVRKFGAGVSLPERTPIAAILERPADWMGKSAAVEGQVTGVCERMGCWLEIRADQDGRSLRVKVKDGEIAFPTAAMGRRAAAEGVVEKISMSREQYIAYREHEAAETGAPFDRSAVAAGESFEVVRLRGTGAEICL